MAIIALVALGFGAMFELKHHVERDRVLRLAVAAHRKVTIHFKRALECRNSDDRHLPYPAAERTKLLTGDGVIGLMPPSGFLSWDGELNYHLYWGYRLFDQLDRFDRHLAVIEARLLLPIPPGP